MKRYLYFAKFRAYDKPMKEKWESDILIDIGIVENWILTLCSTAILIEIFEIDLDSGRRYERRILYKDNRIYHEEPYKP